MSYAKDLDKRLRAKRALKASKAADPVAPSAELAAIIGDVHAHRYPKHADPAKGQVFGGACNTTRCDSHRAVFFNRGTYGLYCVRCGRGQNGNDPVPISVLVEAKPTLAEMDRMHAEMMAEMGELNRLA